MKTIAALIVSVFLVGCDSTREQVEEFHSRSSPRMTGLIKDLFSTIRDGSHTVSFAGGFYYGLPPHTVYVIQFGSQGDLLRLHFPEWEDATLGDARFSLDPDPAESEDWVQHSELSASLNEDPELEKLFMDFVDEFELSPDRNPVKQYMADRPESKG